MSIFLLSLALLLVQNAEFVCCQEVSLYHITPSLDILCPQDPCLTLSQFAANYTGNDTNISLIFLPGNHSLDTELYLSRIDNVSLTKIMQDDERVFVECRRYFGRFDISNTMFASVIGLHFAGCDNNRVSYVEWFTVEDTIFQGVEGGGTALWLNEVAAASIIRSEFLFNGLQHSNDSYFEQDEIDGGALNILSSSNVSIVSSNFMYNEAENGGVMFIQNSSLHVIQSNFSYNRANNSGGIMVTSDSLINIDNSDFSKNTAASGGVMQTHNDSVNVSCTTFTNNHASLSGGVLLNIYRQSSLNITTSNFSDNSAKFGGGVVYTLFHLSEFFFSITSNAFTNNSADRGGVLYISGYYGEFSFSITSNTFTNNWADIGGAMYIVLSGYYFSESSFSIISSTFTNNNAKWGGVMYITVLGVSSFSITSCAFNNNNASIGGVIDTFGGRFNIAGAAFVNNSAADIGGVFWSQQGSFNIEDSSFIINAAQSYGGVLFAFQSSIEIVNSEFDHTLGSLYAFNCFLTISGNTKFENCTEPSNKTPASNLHSDNRQEGGAITSFLSTVRFNGNINFLNNQARHGGAILATESTVTLYRGAIITIAYNNATLNGSGGGISLKQSDLVIFGTCNISGNHAMKGGGIHATSSTITVYQPGTLQFSNNRAVHGSGIHLEVNSKLYVLKYNTYGNSNFLVFEENHADYGGAVYVKDDTNSGACSLNIECFMQTFALHQDESVDINTENILFSGNNATEQGSNIFGGLLDRCIPSPFAEVYQVNEEIRDQYYSGFNYLQNISNIEPHSISSLPVRVCFCTSEGEPDCSYQPPPIKVKKGEAFTVSLVAVDQVNHSVDANVISFLNSSSGGFGEGQQTQDVGTNCTSLTYNVFSPQDNEIMKLYADGPCGSSIPSIQNLYVHFLDCTCPVGFTPSNKSHTKCECVCSMALSSYITNCDSTTNSVLKENINSWIAYVNSSSQYFVTYPNCPFDYCKTDVSINLNLPDGADAQCNNNRRGVLCGACRENFSLSLGSSRCLACHNLWPLELVAIILAAILAGILLVIALLALNMTVAVGLINGFIFYANIVAANNFALFSSSEPSFPTVFISWLNLDIGIDVCFFDGLDAYIKTWLQLAFPVYVISLVILVIVVSDYSPRFSALIGKRDPIATLATLFLLSYAKLLSINIIALSFATLPYPDSNRIIWLLDGTVSYFKGKHAVLIIMALLIVVIGVPYTLLLFLWQWLVRAPRWKIFKWTRSTKLDVFVSTYHTPYNTKYRFWPGLLLLVRVVLYITASVTVSANPQASLLTTIILVGGLFLFKAIVGVRVHKKSIVDVFETVTLFNLLVLAAFSLYQFKSDPKKQEALIYTSTIVTFLLLVGAIGYHIMLLIKKDKASKRANKYPLTLVQPTKSGITHTSIILPSPPAKNSSDDYVEEGQTIQESETSFIETQNL